MKVFYTRRGLKFIFRRGPVPGISHYHNSCCHYMRHPKTTQERKKWFDVLEECKEYKIKLRLRRSHVNLPNAWDDELVSKRRIKGWKRTKKKKQWM
jgi:hypothetical protein